ncbi:MAG: Maf family protein [Oscillospiraceae bacterium]|nr:Maf family protein [Oscillospiraceae bacterium]
MLIIFKGGIYITKIILASQSAARKSILESFGVKAVIYATNTDESLYGGVNFTPAEIVEGLAQRKARRAKTDINDPGALIIAADTVVWFENKIIGKPENAEDAFNTLKRLSGSEHEVYSGIAVVYDNKIISDYDCAKVKFREIDEEEIREYIKTGEPLSKAGSYGAEGIGAAFIESITGDFFNIAGLPVYKFANILRDNFNLSIFSLRSDKN